MGKGEGFVSRVWVTEYVYTQGNVGPIAAEMKRAHFPRAGRW